MGAFCDGVSFVKVPCLIGGAGLSTAAAPPALLLSPDFDVLCFATSLFPGENCFPMVPILLGALGADLGLGLLELLDDWFFWVSDDMLLELPLGELPPEVLALLNIAFWATTLLTGVVADLDGPPGFGGVFLAPGDPDSFDAGELGLMPVPGFTAVEGVFGLGPPRLVVRFGATGFTTLD